MTVTRLHKRIEVINPNSSAHVTAAIGRAAAGFAGSGMQINCVSMAEGPAGIETEADLYAAIGPMWRHAMSVKADAFVIACFGDPGLFLLREALSRPVFGIAECGMMQALRLGESVGIISILEQAIPRHLRYFRAMGVQQRIARDRAIGMHVAELDRQASLLDRMIAAGRRLRHDDGADVVLMAGAAMSAIRGDLEEALGIPVVDPTAAAIAAAVGSLSEAKG